MSTQLSFDDQAHYLKVTMSGDFPLDPNFFERIRDEAERLNRSRLLFITWGVTPPKSDLDRFWSGKIIADVFGHRFKIAALIPQEYITKFGENAAVNRGARLLVTPDEHAALEWLLN